MKKLFSTAIFVTALSASLSAAVGQERTLITTVRPRQDCNALEEARGSSPEAYGEYASCVIDNSYIAFRALYDRHLRYFPKEEQDVVAKFRVGTDGSVENAEASSPGISDSEFLRKVAARIRLLKFLPSDAGAQEVSHTFKFSEPER